MELRRLTVCIAVFLLVVVTRCSEARHSLHRRASDDINYDDSLLGDAASDNEAQNDADGGEEEMEEEIIVNSSIITKPDNYHISVGRNVRLDCKVTPENVVVQWSFSNQEKKDVKYFIGHSRANAPDRISVVSNSTDLLIRDAQASDSGSYKCLILEEEERHFIVHNVSVTESPRIIRFVASDGDSLVEGQDLLLTCDVAGSPPPQIIWSREKANGLNERLQERDGEFSRNSVFIKNVTREHTGKYYCYALNYVGNSQAELTVKIYGKPRVRVHKTIVNSAIDVEAVLQCSAHEDSPVHIRWYKDGKLIEDSSSLFVVSTHGTHSNLTVIPAGDGDFGTFTCEAENTFGKHNRSIDLVQYPVVEQLNVNGSELSWKVHSHQPLQRIELLVREATNDSWKSIEVPIPETRGHKYNVIYVIDGKLSPGTYEAVVKVKNSKSWSNQVNPVKVDIEAQAHPIIQPASVFRSDAHSIRQTTAAVLSTTLMYLLVRML